LANITLALATASRTRSAGVDGNSGGEGDSAMGDTIHAEERGAAVETKLLEAGGYSCMLQSISTCGGCVDVNGGGGAVGDNGTGHMWNGSNDDGDIVDEEAERMRLATPALELVMKQLLEHVANAVADSSNTLACATATALLGSSLLRTTLEQAGYGQNAYAQVSTLCSEQLLRLETTFGADFYTDDQVSRKFGQICTKAAKETTSLEDRPLRHDDNGGVPDGLGVNNAPHRVYAPYLLALAAAALPGMVAACVAAVVRRSSLSSSQPSLATNMCSCRGTVLGLGKDCRSSRMLSDHAPVCLKPACV
jgi:hypothetical protein